ncbi:type II and III secretion system protein family protein [Blastochloris viridis]|uniref:General secretion pathway protein D n=1 Tax=Blastochloris viridis TaxID=1079 RepID=A0A0H5BEL3_BLAVI|nr:type II and III secretion system protein family protein [Blastochloris viridis]ALK10529.1 Type II secretion system protein D precursor [Blastochloris viridis]BAR99519.1 type II/IV secretion system secretin RcpA/CpaC [Blastochloris viridis]CUU43191.1 General secretion pathway protein D precursor [Blastochloris viridis]
MKTTWLHRAVPATLAATLLLVPAAPSPVAAAEPVVRVADGDSGSRMLALGRGKSVAIELPRDAKDVLVVDPDVANAVVRSARRVFVVGVKAGQTNIVFFDTDGRQIAAFDITVGVDTAALQATLRRLMPNGDIRVDAAGKAVVLSGTVANAADAAQAVSIAATFLADAKGSGSGDSKPASSGDDGTKNVINRLTIRAKEQVMLKVVVAEVKRTVVKQLGVDLNGTLTVGTDIALRNYTNVFPVNGGAIANGGLGNAGGSGIAPVFNGSGGTVAAIIQAMEQAGVMRTLAEPTLTAISGEQAKFLAGGEFPVAAGRNCDTSGYCTVDIQWKPFGVGLDFTPVVLSEGRISLRVGTEVSELSSDNTVQTTAGIIPSLKVRRASSTVELPSGGSIMMAGLIKEETKQSVNGTPGLQSLPVLGTLFRSRDYQSGQTELMVMVTPYIVNAVARSELQTPDEGFAPASDPSTILLGRINRIYGVAGKVDPTRPYHGTYGFIID